MTAPLNAPSQAAIEAARERLAKANGHPDAAQSYGSGHYDGHPTVQALAIALQEISDAVKAAIAECSHDGMRAVYIASHLDSFILLESVDPLVEALNESLDRLGAFDAGEADNLRKAIEARGGKIVWQGGDA